MSEKSKDILIGVLLTVIVGLIILIILIITDTITFSSKFETNQNENNITETTKLTESEAITIGKELYDKMTEIKGLEVLLPYCGVKGSEIRNQSMKKYNISTYGPNEYYETKYSNTDELKNELRNYMSETYVNEVVDREPITDLSLLSKEDYLYVDYIIDNNKLYCRAYSAGGWAPNYLDYDITVNNVEKNIISYNINSKYIKDSALGEICNKEKINNCKEEDLEYKDTTFVIEKNSNDKWLVTNFTLHD